jgi:hypothetical protein
MYQVEVKNVTEKSIISFCPACSNTVGLYFIIKSQNSTMSSNMYSGWTLKTSGTSSGSGRLGRYLSTFQSPTIIGTNLSVTRGCCLVGSTSRRSHTDTKLANPTHLDVKSSCSRATYIVSSVACNLDTSSCPARDKYLFKGNQGTTHLASLYRRLNLCLCWTLIASI